MTQERLSNLRCPLPREASSSISGRIAARAARAPADPARVEAGTIPFPRFRAGRVVEPSCGIGAVADRPLELLSYDDMQRMFGRTGRSLRRWVAAGHLGTVRVGRSVFFRAADVQRLIGAKLTLAVLARAGAHRASKQAKRSVQSSHHVIEKAATHHL